MTGSPVSTIRLDLALVERGLASSRTRAQRLLRDGLVRLNGHLTTRGSQPVSASDLVVVDLGEEHRWVSRAALKLDRALDELDPDGRLFAGSPVVLDAGASTGGFTQVCLERGARLVHAVDVGHDQLHPDLRADPRVHVVEGFNLRDLTPESLPGPVDLVVCDVSFISVRLLLGPLFSVLAPHGRALVMVKPQFEVGREALGSGGLVTDPALQEGSVQQVIADARQLGWQATEPRPAAIPGTHGNQEFFVLFGR